MTDADEIQDLTPIWARDLPEPRPWQDHGHETAFENGWMRVTVHDAVAPTGAPARYAVMRPRNIGVGVLPIHGDGTVTLVGQHRFALMRYSWEMPEGGCPEGEDPFAAVQRELAEEAGIKAAGWAPALSMDLSNSVTDEQVMTWIAWDLSPAPGGHLDDTEDLEAVRVPFTVLLDEVTRGAVRDSLTVATVYRAYHMAREHLLPGWLAHVMLHRA